MNRLGDLLLFLLQLYRTLIWGDPYLQRFPAWRCYHAVVARVMLKLNSIHILSLPPCRRKPDALIEK